MDVEDDDTSSKNVQAGHSPSPAGPSLEAGTSQQHSLAAPMEAVVPAAAPAVLQDIDVAPACLHATIDDPNTWQEAVAQQLLLEMPDMDQEQAWATAGLMCDVYAVSAHS